MARFICLPFQFNVCIICVLNFVTFVKGINVWNSLRGSRKLDSLRGFPLRSNSHININSGGNRGFHARFIYLVFLQI
jgi:hypothetical protein